MKLYRLVGEVEKEKLIAGETLINNTNWSLINDTNSVGFCFFAYNRSKKIEKVISAALNDWLDGIASTDYIVEVELKKVKKSHGWYACGCRAEYNVNTYSIKDVKSIHKIVKLDVKDWKVEKDCYFYCYDAKKVF